MALVRAVARIGAPPSALIGVRYALERGRGRQPVPVGTALLGMVLAVVALSATAVFGASLTRLISSPALYGVPFQAEFKYQGAGSGAAITGPVLTSLRNDREIERITVATIAGIEVNGHQVRLLAATAIRGPALISVVDGRLPRGHHEIMLGAATMRSVGAQPGGLVRVIVTDPEGAPHQAQFRVVGRASFAPSFYTGGESVNFPLLFGGMLALFGAATMVHLLLVSVSRRRAEAGLLKVDVLLVATLAIGVLAAANVLAFFPALLAARSRPAQLLRAE